jgi:hypothetical protein
MLTYLFDASAAVEIYAPRNDRVKRIINHILAQKDVHRGASLFIPNFCIAEGFNTLARKHFDPKERDAPLDVRGYEKA